MNSIGRRVRMARDHYKMSQGDFADSLNVKQSYLSYVENDKRTPTDAFLEKMYNKYNINAEWILKGTGTVIDGKTVELKAPPTKTLTDLDALRAIFLGIEENIGKSGKDFSPEIRADLAIGYYRYFMDADNASAKEIKKHIDLTFGAVVSALQR